VERIDFGDIFSPIAKLTYIRVGLFIVFSFDTGLENMDPKIAFLHVNFEEEIYMNQP
jgi:hypothetical protein